MAEARTRLELDVGDMDHATVVVVDGEIDLETADRLERLGSELPERAVPLVLDLRGVTFMDSSGMRALMSLAQATDGQGRVLALLRPSAAVTRFLDLVDLRRRFVEVPDASADTLVRIPDASG